MTPPTMGPTGVFFFVDVVWLFELPVSEPDPEDGFASAAEESLVGCGALEPLSLTLVVCDEVSELEEMVVVNQVLPVWPL